MSIQSWVKERVLGTPEATVQSCFITQKCSITHSSVETLVQKNLKRT